MHPRVHLPFLALVVLALRGIDVCVDDLPQIVLRTGPNAVEEWWATPVLMATHGSVYAALGYGHFWLYDLLKMAWLALAYGMSYRFASLWMPPAQAALFAALFLFFPAHDSTVFWFSNQYLTLTSAFFLYAFYLAQTGRAGGAAGLAALGSFISYGSPPWAFALAIPFVRRRQWRQTFALLAPQIVYVAYYVILTETFRQGSKRLPEAFDPVGVAKQLALQLAGGLDSVLGPSLWLKIAWSIGSLTLPSAAIGVAIGLLLLRVRPSAPGPSIPATAWITACAVAALGFGMLALTGSYPQSAFGVGNRVTLYASFPVALALAALATRPLAYAAIAAVLVFATLGISDHWRDWRRVQDETIAAIRAHGGLTEREMANGTLFVVGRDYSRLGPIGHVAFLSDIWVTDAVFALALGERKRFRAVPLSARFDVTAEGLVDSKHGTRYPVRGGIDVYDAAQGSLRRVDAADLPRFVAAQRPPPRHWIQLVDAPWLTGLVRRWMPRLEYLFPREQR